MAARGLISTFFLICAWALVFQSGKISTTMLTRTWLGS
jgi:hypothetical protein